MACTRFFLVPEDFVSEVDAMIEKNDQAGPHVIDSASDASGDKCESTEPTTPTLLASSPIDQLAFLASQAPSAPVSAPTPSWIGLFGLGLGSESSAGSSPVSLLPYNPVASPSTAKLGVIGSQLRFELAPATSLVGLVPSEATWFTVNTTDVLLGYSFAMLAWKLMSEHVMGTCWSEAGHVVLLFSAGGRLVVAAV